MIHMVAGSYPKILKAMYKIHKSRLSVEGSKKASSTNKKYSIANTSSWCRQGPSSLQGFWFSPSGQIFCNAQGQEWASQVGHGEQAFKGFRIPLIQQKDHAVDWLGPPWLDDKLALLVRIQGWSSWRASLGEETLEQK